MAATDTLTIGMFESPEKHLSAVNTYMGISAFLEVPHLVVGEECRFKLDLADSRKQPLPQEKLAKVIE